MVDTYSCLTASTLAKLVEIEEELLDSNSVFSNSGLQAFLNVQLTLQLTAGLSKDGLLLTVLACDGYR